MPDQVTYYNKFGEQFEQSILDCPEPELWTTDYEEKGRIYHEMKERINQQEKLFIEFLNPAHSVLDIGCGFGRQAFLLTKKGFTVTGTDTSNAFIEIAKKLFGKHKYEGIFLCLDILTEKLNQQFNQLILLDVLEHIRPNQRNIFFSHLVEIIGSREGGVLILSLPHVKKRLSSQINNLIRRRITQYIPSFFEKEEHPYPIPQKKEILRLARRSFSLLKFIESAETDYYVFRRN